MIKSLILSSTVPAAAARKSTLHQLCANRPAVAVSCSPVGSEMMSSTDLSWKGDNVPSLVPVLLLISCSLVYQGGLSDHFVLHFKEHVKLSLLRREESCVERRRRGRKKGEDGGDSSSSPSALAGSWWEGGRVMNEGGRGYMCV